MPGKREIIAITGHRDYADRGALLRGLDRLKADEYVFGGARGADTDALEHIGKTQPGSRRTVVVPNRLGNQSKYSQTIIKRYGTEVVELKNTGANRFQIRNQNMVNRSTKLHAFYDFRGRGGTFNTIKYAELIGKPFETTPMTKINLSMFKNMKFMEFKNWVLMQKNFRVPLRTIKGIIILVLHEIFNTTVQELLEVMGASGITTLESMWLE